MIHRQMIEMTLLQITCQDGEPLDGHALYTIRIGVAQALQAEDDCLEVSIEEAYSKEIASHTHEIYTCIFSPYVTIQRTAALPTG